MSDRNSSKTIFIADDDSDDRFFIKRAVATRHIDAQVVEAENGIDLIELLQSTQLDVSLILVDMNMPRMNGLETILQLQNVPSVVNVPMVIISTSPSEQLVRQADQAGVAAVFRKPDSIEGFELLIEELQTKFLI